MTEPMHEPYSEPTVCHPEVGAPEDPRFLMRERPIFNRLPGGGPLRCSWCGSLHPREAAEMIRNGSRLEIADRKYGWPHKAYLSDPWGKFYTVHLQDASDEDREVIERAYGLRFTFYQDKVSWTVYAKLEPQEDDGEVA